MRYIDMVSEGKENFKNLKEEELDISSIELERKIKYALLDTLKEDLVYNYRTSIKYSKKLYGNDLFLFFNHKNDLIGATIGAIYEKDFEEFGVVK